jgi:ABC-type branched-subunit amino acid transport system ATPase component
MIYGPDFVIHDIDKPVVSRLLSYFMRDQGVAKAEGIDLDKGILLAGPIGCGKTALMNIMRGFRPGSYRHIIRPCRDISFEFSQEGFSVINRYGKNAFFQNTNIPKVYCFDDLGMESSVAYFGNNSNVLGEILLSRYDLFISHQMITHATTNLNANELEVFYGNRLRSRMRAMFNLISYDSNTTDKRK